MDGPSTGARRHTRLDQQRRDTPRGLHRRPARLHRPRDGADPVGPRVLDHRQRRRSSECSIASSTMSVPTARSSARRISRRNRRHQRLCLQPDQQRGLQSRIRDDAIGLRGGGERSIRTARQHPRGPPPSEPLSPRRLSPRPTGGSSRPWSASTRSMSVTSTTTSGDSSTIRISATPATSSRSRVAGHLSHGSSRRLLPPQPRPPPERVVPAGPIIDFEVPAPTAAAELLPLPLIVTSTFPRIRIRVRFRFGSVRDPWPYPYPCPFPRPWPCGGRRRIATEGCIP